MTMTLMSFWGVSCSQLLTKTPSTGGNGYASQAGQQGGYYDGQQAAQPQGNYYGGGYDQAQVYPNPGNTHGSGASAAQSAYDAYGASAPAYQPPAQSYQQQAYTAPAPAYTPPAYTGSTTGGQTYTVQKGDNLYRISQMHGTSVQNLMSVNGLSSDVIYPGDVLTIR